MDAPARPVVLVTGGTGNLGSRATVELLKDETVSVVQLVPRRSQEEAEASVKKVLDFWECPEAHRARVSCLPGDIVKRDLGLPAQAYGKLQSEVSHIVHCAAIFKHGLTLQEARANMVDGTKHLVALAASNHARGTFKKLIHVSTEEVAGDLPGIKREELLTGVPRRFFNTYEQAKAETEDYFAALIERESFPVTICRPGSVVGDSQTGKIINPQGIYLMIHDLFLAPEYPFVPIRDEFLVDAIPLDVAAAGLALLCFADEAAGKVYHLSSGYQAAVSERSFLGQVQEIYASLTGTRKKLPKFVPLGLVRLVLAAYHLFSFGALREKLEAQRALLRFFQFDVRFDSGDFRTFMAKHGIAVPALPEYLPVLCKYYLEHNPELASLYG